MSAGNHEGILWIGIGKGAVVVQQTNQTTIRTHFRNESLLDGDWHNLAVSFDGLRGLSVSLDDVILINDVGDVSDVIVDLNSIVRSSELYKNIFL